MLRNDENSQHVDVTGDDELVDLTGAHAHQNQTVNDGSFTRERSYSFTASIQHAADAQVAPDMYCSCSALRAL